MGRALALVAWAVVACGGAPKMPASGERLLRGDLINREMCVQLADRLFDVLADSVPASVYRATSTGTHSVGLRTTLAQRRAEAKSPAAIEDCTERYVKAQYLCVMATDDPHKALRCLAMSVADLEKTPEPPPTLEPIADPWIEVESDHFLVWTDLANAPAQALAHRLEDVRAAMLAVVFQGTQVNVRRSRVIALASYNGWRRFSDGTLLGRAFPAEVNPFRESILLVSSGRGVQGAESVMSHELFHHISTTVIRRQPRWFAEGVATYFETVEIDRAAGTALVGRPPAFVAEDLDKYKPAHMQPLVGGSLDKTVEGHQAVQFYASSYLLTAYLMNKHPEELATYQRLLKQTGDADSLRVWHEAFPSLPLDGVEHEVMSWWYTGSHIEISVRLPPAPVSLVVRPLSDADVYLARAILYLGLSTRKIAHAKLNIEAALRADPHHVLANVLAVGVQAVKLDAAAAQAIVHDHPEDWLAWSLLLAELPQGTAERSDAQHEMCKRAAAHPAAQLPEEACP